MAHQIVWSNLALESINSIAEYISKDSPAYASRVVDNIYTATRQLIRFPNSGRFIPESHSRTYREVFAYNFRILYRVEGSRVIIVNVIHGKQELHGLQ